MEGCDEQTGGKELTYLTHNVACAARRVGSGVCHDLSMAVLFWHLGCSH